MQRGQQLSEQPAQYFPPNLLNQYRNNQQFQREMNVKQQMIEATKQQAVENAVQEANRQWEQKLSQLQTEGLLQPGSSWAQQARSNPQLAAQLSAAQKQVAAGLGYKIMRADYQSQRQWQKWIKQQEADFQKRH